MSILGRIFGRSEPQQIQGKAILDPIGTGWTMLSGNWPHQWKDSSEIFRPMTVMEKEMAYRHPIIKACCDEIAFGLTKPKLEYGYWKNDEEWVSEPHPLLDLLKRPFANYGFRRMMSLWIIRYLLTGTGYVQKFYGPLGPAALVPYPTSWVTPTYSQFTGFVDYYTVNGQANPVRPQDMMLLESLDPGNLWGGVSALDAALNDLLLDREGQEYLAEMLENLKVAGMIIMARGGIKEGQRAQFLADIHNSIGKGKRGDPLLLSGEYDIDQTNPLGDMDWPGFGEAREARICMSFQVPPIIIGARIGMANSTYANYQETRRSFYLETLGNLWPMLEEVLNYGLLYPMDYTEGGYPMMQQRVTDDGQERTFRFRSDKLPELQDDLNVKSTRIVSEFVSGIIPRETAQQELDYDTYQLKTLLEEERKEKLQHQTEEKDNGIVGSDQKATATSDGSGEQGAGGES